MKRKLSAVKSGGENASFTFPSPGVSLILLAARRRQGGAGGGASKRAVLKLVGKRAGSHDATADVAGTCPAAAAAAAFCFFFFEARFSFCAALRGKETSELVVNFSNRNAVLCTQSRHL